MSGIRALSELILSAENGVAADRGLDASVWYSLVERPPSPSAVDRDMVDKWPGYSSNIDEVVSLIGRTLPGYMWQVKQGIECSAIVWSLGIDYDDEGCKTVGYTTIYPARALLAACLRAVQERAAKLADATPKKDSP